ncbi:hypothetical protein NSE_0597 [Neorickettsia sennetsu str. Miyayama]|uniref:Uncharacterized protein n=1 Tax=Ehrlichia sennetsu (strain ATCC VR-367 / Miyayama) TaxID=222891 RepID=Q2GDG9_EHRS3|nr:hypothetical protein NSE_0597 [Neorickettsia sennetsu str. Miyayama]
MPNKKTEAFQMKKNKQLDLSSRSSSGNNSDFGKTFLLLRYRRAQH